MRKLFADILKLFKQWNEDRHSDASRKKSALELEHGKISINEFRLRHAMPLIEESVNWQCEWCLPDPFVDNAPNKCRIIFCSKCGGKTWHYPKVVEGHPSSVADTHPDTK